MSDNGPNFSRESIDQPEMDELGRALMSLRQARRISRATAGERFRDSEDDKGIGEEGWRKYEIGRNRAIFTPSVQHKLAAAVGASRDDLLAERARLGGAMMPPLTAPTPGDRRSWILDRGSDQLTLLPIVERVQAGAWTSVDDTSQVAPPTHPVARDPRFPHARQWLSEVSGDSVNLLNIVDGDLVHCVDAVDIRYFPRTGDVVTVERRRAGGHERELTIKQIEVTADKILLWPRSTNPRWNGPLEVTSELEQDEEAEVQIRGLVLASIRRF